MKTKARKCPTYTFYKCSSEYVHVPSCRCVVLRIGIDRLEYIVHYSIQARCYKREVPSLWSHNNNNNNNNMIPLLFFPTDVLHSAFTLSSMPFVSLARMGRMINLVGCV